MNLPRKVIVSTAIAFLALALIIAGVIGWQYFSRPVIDVSIPDEVSQVSILAAPNENEDIESTEDDQKVAPVAELSSSGTVRLKEGNYLYQLEGEGVDSTAVSFQVPIANDELQIDFKYTAEKLQVLYQQTEKQSINQALKSSLGDAAKGYQIQDGTLFHKGEWYGTLLSKGRLEEALAYRVVMQKQGDEWRVVRYPEPILSAAHYPEVPADILDSLNRQPLF